MIFFMFFPALMFAAKGQHESCVSRLLQCSDCDVNATDSLEETALTKCFNVATNDNIVSLLLQHGAQVLIVNFHSMNI